MLKTVCCCFYSDVISIEKTGEHFRLIYDVKGRFTVHRITAEEAKVRIVNRLVLRFELSVINLSF